MRVLVACEFSGRVRDAFTMMGHDAVSMDIVPSEKPGRHVIADVQTQLSPLWDMLIAFPPCTYLAGSGRRWYWGTEEQEDALAFVELLLCAPIKRIALENPVGAISTNIAKPTQIIHPYYFGDAVQKRTCLWLKNLPPLVPTNMLPKPELSDIHYMGPITGRRKERSRTFPGIALAMAQQWGSQ